MERYILKYLLDHTDSSKEKRFVDYMKVDLDERLWSMGNQTPNTYDYQCSLRKWQAKHAKEIGLLRRVKRYIWQSFFSQKSNTNVDYQNVILEERQCAKKVFSLINLPKDVISQFSRIGIEIFHISRCDSNNLQTINHLQSWYKASERLSFNELLIPERYCELDELINAVKDEIKNANFDALLVQTSELFYQKIFIDIFKELKRPSITLLHGLPGVYSLATENRVDYLLVWGNRIKEHFEAINYDSQKVIVAGNYKCKIKNNLLLTPRNSLDDVLVLTTSTHVIHQHDWEWKKFPTNDRSLLVTYLYSVETVLKSVGVSHARLRPHPSISKDWLMEYVDKKFYVIDNDELDGSLLKSTLCIGPTSTTFLEAMTSGVVYLVYEPGDGVYSMNNAYLVPPFDGSDKRLQVAFTEAQLRDLILQSYCPDISLINDYLQPFDVNIVNEIIRTH